MSRTVKTLLSSEEKNNSKAQPSMPNINDFQTNTAQLEKKEIRLHLSKLNKILNPYLYVQHEVKSYLAILMSQAFHPHQITVMHGHYAVRSILLQQSDLKESM